MKFEEIKQDAYKNIQECILIYGKTGVGKTYACIEYFLDKKQEFAVINLENRLNHLTRYFGGLTNILTVKSYTDFDNLRKNSSLLKDKGLVVDSISAFYDMLIQHYGAKRQDDLIQKDWGSIKYDLNEFIFALLKASGKSMLMTAREKLEKDNKEDKFLPDIKKEVPYNYVNTIIRYAYDKNDNRQIIVKKDTDLPYNSMITKLSNLQAFRDEYCKKHAQKQIV